jgi:hypothetical protein
MTTIPEHRLLEILTVDGLSAGDWLLVVETEVDWPFVWDPTRGPLACLIEEEALAEAVVGHLKGSGARRFASLSELLKAARAEQWPGWEWVCAQAPVRLDVPQ